MTARSKGWLHTQGQLLGKQTRHYYTDSAGQTWQSVSIGKVILQVASSWSYFYFCQHNMNAKRWPVKLWQSVNVTF
jgi:hypothetical protein